MIDRNFCGDCTVCKQYLGPHTERVIYRDYLYCLHCIQEMNLTVVECLRI